MSLLRSLTNSPSNSFDLGCLRFELADIHREDKNEVTYYRSGDCLMALHTELENSKFRGLVEEWLERRSGAQYVMLTALVGVLFAVSLSIASLGVTSYQTGLCTNSASML